MSAENEIPAEILRRRDAIGQCFRDQSVLVLKCTDGKAGKGKYVFHLDLTRVAIMVKDAEDQAGRLMILLDECLQELELMDVEKMPHRLARIRFKIKNVITHGATCRECGEVIQCPDDSRQEEILKSHGLCERCFS